MFGTAVVTAAFSVSAFPPNPVRYPSSPVREGMVNTVRDVPMATSGTNLYMAWVNNDTYHV
jgi:hypothetical protein